MGPIAPPPLPSPPPPMLVSCGQSFCSTTSYLFTTVDEMGVAYSYMQFTCRTGGQCIIVYLKLRHNIPPFFNQFSCYFCVHRLSRLSIQK